MRHTCAYDAIRKLGVFTDAGGSEWYVRAEDAMVKHTWLYDPAQRRWLEPIRQPFPGGGSVSPIAVPTPKGVIVYQHAPGREWEDSGQMWRLVGTPGRPDSWGWEPIEILGPERPHQREFMTIVHDSRRDRLVFLSYDPQTKDPQMWFFGMQSSRSSLRFAVKLNAVTVGTFDLPPTLCEAMYDNSFLAQKAGRQVRVVSRR